MQVFVQPLKIRGVARHADALRLDVPLQGDLVLRERKAYWDGRTVRTARVLERKDAIEQDVLPELSDAQLLAVKDNEMTFAGYERIDGQAFAQSWSVRAL
jgi:hypothetical protein